MNFNSLVSNAKLEFLIIISLKDINMDYSHKAIEKKWQKHWDKGRVFETKNLHDKKAFILDMFPYPSGQGLHVGHVKGYTATDVFSRFRRLQGYDVLHPIGWDAFGLPAEQYALTTGNDPREFTLKNIDNFKRQLKSLGFSYDFNKELSTAHPSFYKTTQWIFGELYKKGLAEIREVDVNWSEALGTVLANDEILIKNGVMVSERGNYPVVKRKMRQWVLKITDYAEELLEGLNKLDWPQSIKDLQKNWIGRSQGTTINFQTVNGIEIPIFTTRPDTLFGATYIVLAPENSLVKKLTMPEYAQEVEEYIAATKQKTEIDRKDDSKPKTGVFLGTFAINPITNEPLPIWVADYVLNDYATGSVMAVPAHDNRDWMFAKKYGLPVRFVIESEDETKAFVGEGKHINSRFLNGLNRIEAIERINKELLKQGLGEISTHYKFRDWLFSRQRFWGEPFPIVYNDKNEIILLEPKDLPIELPKVKYIKPSATGESPLAKVESWVNTTHKNQKVRRETNTMPQSAGSSWYFLAYILATAPNQFLDLTSKEAKKELDKWLPVDLYVGGQEHAVGHLLYARFWTRFLHKQGYLKTPEPFKRYFNQGMILGPDGKKMSKSLGNVINPDDILVSHGADALRLYEMFMGPLEASLPWSYDGLDGAQKWLNRVYRLVRDAKLVDTNNGNLDLVYHQTVKKVTSLVEKLHFNTAISQLMVLVNAFYKESKAGIYRPYLEGFIIMLSPFVPHLASELWEMMGHKDYVDNQSWPSYETEKLKVTTTNIALQVNGKLRALLKVKLDVPKEELLALAKREPNIQKYLADKKIIKEIVVPNKIINWVVE